MPLKTQICKNNKIAVFKLVMKINQKQMINMKNNLKTTK